MKVIHSVSEFQDWRGSQSKPVAFVPTMGALHRGHAELLRQARSYTLTNGDTGGSLVLSIFVNPTQFNDAKDLQAYPRTWEEDLKIATECGVDVVFAPEFADMYPDQYLYSVSENQKSLILCGASRPGHFNGVLTVVMKLFQVVRPHRAFFGEKDFQQLQLIRDMAQAFFLPLTIQGVPTVREDSGLALSSRNVRLSEDGRRKASLIFKTLTQSQNVNDARKTLEKHGFQIDYVEEHWGRRFAAVFLEGVRLIDNVSIAN